MVKVYGLSLLLEWTGPNLWILLLEISSNFDSDSDEVVGQFLVFDIIVQVVLGCLEMGELVLNILVHGDLWECKAFLETILGVNLEKLIAITDATLLNLSIDLDSLVVVVRVQSLTELVHLY
jgi:hypothetical protein